MTTDTTLPTAPPSERQPPLDRREKSLRETAKSSLLQAMDRFRAAGTSGTVTVAVAFEGGCISDVDARTFATPGPAE